MLSERPPARIISALSQFTLIHKTEASGSFRNTDSTTHRCKVKVKWSCYRPGVAQRVGRDIAVLFHDRGTRRGWVVSSTPQPHFTPGEDPIPIVEEAGWAPGPAWTGRKSRPHWDYDPRTVQPVAQSLYRLSYPAHTSTRCENKTKGITSRCNIRISLHFAHKSLFVCLYFSKDRQPLFP